MAFTEKIRILFEINDKAAVGSFGNITKSVKEADGANGKMRAGLGATSDFLKANVAGAAVAAGAALVTFGAKAVGAFADAALEAGKFADATGLAVDDASRWIEVAGDIGIEAGTIEGAFLKMNKAIADGKPAIEEYGVQVVKTKDGIVDSNATMLNAITTVGAIEDPTLRAKAAQEIFGRSYGEVAELMEMSATDVKAALDGVSESKVIDEAELEKARDYRERMDNLKDTFEDVQLAAGELVVGMAPVITKIADVAKGIIDVSTAVADFVFAAKPASSEAQAWWDAVGGQRNMSRGDAVVGFLDRFNEQIDNKSNLDKATTGAEAFFKGLSMQADGADFRFETFKETFDELAAKSPEMAEQLLTDMGKLRGGTDNASLGFQEWAEYAGLTDERMIELANRIPATVGATDDLAASTETAAGNFTTFDRSAADAADEVKRAKDKIEDAEQAIRDMDDALSDLKGNLDNREAFRNMNEALGELQTKIDESLAGGEVSWTDLEEATDGAVGAVADYIESAANIPPEVKTELYAQLNDGDLDAVNEQVTLWTNGIDLPIRPKIVGANASLISIQGGQAIPRFDSGGVMPGPKGEHNLALVAGGETILPTHKGPAAASSGGPSVVIDMRGAVGLSGPEVERWVGQALDRWNRRTGRS